MELLARAINAVANYFHKKKFTYRMCRSYTHLCFFISTCMQIVFIFIVNAVSCSFKLRMILIYKTLRRRQLYAKNVNFKYVILYLYL